MNILIDINHPADVHQFKHIIASLQKKHSVTVLARDKECTLDLLKEYKIPFIPRKGYKGLIGKAIGMIAIEMQLLHLVKEKSIDVLVGSSGDVYITHVGTLLRKPSVLFDDTEHALIQKRLSFPFATKIVVPKVYYREFSPSQEKKVIRYKGYKELAYLSPDYFRQKKKVLGKFPNILLRLVSWEASHDAGHGGFQDVDAFVKFLSSKGTLHISSEQELPKKFKKYQLKSSASEFHQVLANMDLVVSEGGTVAAESAVLGIPSIYVNDLHMGYTDDLVKRKLLFQTTDEDKIIELAKQLTSASAKRQFQQRKKKLLSEADDVNKCMEQVILSCKRT